MIAITTKPSLSFDDYLKYNDGTDNRYELFDGELILMNPPTGRHALIIRNLCNLLENEFVRLGLLWVALQMFGLRTAWRRSPLLPELALTANQILQV